MAVVPRKQPLTSRQSDSLVWLVKTHPFDLVPAHGAYRRASALADDLPVTTLW
jgi:hypothetical protein